MKKSRFTESQIVADIRLIMSHLACAEQQDHFMNARQMERFNDYRALFPNVSASLANPSGIFPGDSFVCDLVRFGAALYGIAPVEGQPNPLKQVVNVRARVIQLRTIDSGDYVGYGVRYRAQGKRVIATLGIGYADGWPRAASGHTLAFTGASSAPMVGTVSMDSITIDVTDLGEAGLSAGDPMDLICQQQTVDDVAASAGTIDYELLTRLGSQFHRVYIDQSM